MGNAEKGADCPDGSDELFEACCAGDFPKYDATVCSSKKQCVTSRKIITAAKYCDGTELLGNAVKQPDCDDSSDEIMEICCAGNYANYDATVCS